jgi:hypothetical protein
MDQLIFIALIVFFSIIESIARSRKKRQGGGTLPEIPEEVARDRELQWEMEQSQRRQRTRPAPPTSEVPSYDDDSSFDARTAGQVEGRSFEPEATFDESAAAESERNKRAASSEAMIPAELWEEIAGLARGAKVELPTPRPRPRPRLPQTQLPQERRVPQPKRPAPKPARVRSRPAPPSARDGISRPSPAMEGTAGHAVHLSHADYGSDPSQRARSAQDGLDPLARTLGADAASVRQQLRGRSAHALRQALILQEVLGPPVASRD